MKAGLKLPVGWRAWSLGVLAIGVLTLVFGDFVPGQPAPKQLPDRTLLAYAAGAFLVVATAAIQWRRTVASAAAALTAYYTLVVVVLMNGRVVLRHLALFEAYSSAAEQVALATAGLIVWAGGAGLETPAATRLTRLGQVVFGVCAVLFGGAHFAYMNLTAPLVPKWLPPSQVFWGYATGIAHIAAGIAIITGVQARLAAILLTVMYACFTPLVHIPLLLSDPNKHFYWTENALNLALTGAAWVVADSLARPARKPK